MFTKDTGDQEPKGDLLELVCDAVFEICDDSSLRLVAGVAPGPFGVVTFEPDIVNLAPSREAANYKAQFKKQGRAVLKFELAGKNFQVIGDRNSVPPRIGIQSLGEFAKSSISLASDRLLEAIPIGIAIVHGDDARINPALAQLLGESDVEIPIEKLFGSIFGAKWSRKRRDVMRQGDRKHVVTMRTGFRFERIVEVVAVSEGKNELWIIEDVTERVRSEERFQAVFENSSDAYALIDENGIYECNEAALRMFAVGEKSDLIGRLPSDFSPETQPDGWSSSRKRNFVNELSRRHGFYRFEWMHESADGRQFPVEISITIIPFGNRTIELAVWHDLTDRKATETQLIQLAEELQLANVSLVQARDAALESARAKSAFLATMSHEIRTPLNGILGMTRLLLSTSLGDEQRVYAETVQASGQMLLRVINDVLDLSKIEAGKLTIDPAPCDLASTVQEVVTLFAGQAKEKQLRLEYAVDETARSWYLADAVRIKQIVGNLIGNAIKFTANGGVFVRLSATPDGDAGRIKVEVSDTGIGIHPSRIGAIFESFTQADRSTQRSFGGTGLGLTICRRLVDLMDGTINVQSEPGVGSSFWFELELPRAEAVSAANGLATSEQQFAGTKVLLAEDNPINVMVAKKHLERLGCVVSVASDGTKAIEMVEAHSFDLVLMDMQMPGVDGLQAARKIRSNEAIGTHIPIIALTANASVEDRTACIDAGMDDFITKPLMVESLSNILKLYVHRDDDYLTALAA